MISSGKATIVELGTVLGYEDLLDLLEIIIIDGHNRRLIAKKD